MPKWARSIQSLLLITLVLGFLPAAVLAETAEEPKPEAVWTTPLPKGSRGIILMYEAVSGKQSSNETDNLMTGVTEITRGDQEIILHRQDGAVLHLTKGTRTGAHYLEGLSKSESKAREKVGPIAGDIVAGLSRLSVQGDKIDIFREPESVDIDVAALRKGRKHVLKEVQLNHISFVIDNREGHSSIKDINGIKVLVRVGFQVAIELKEFSRVKDADGNTVLTFGIKNPVPFPIRKALFMHDVIHVNYVVKKGTDLRQVGSSSPGSI